MIERLKEYGLDIGLLCAGLFGSLLMTSQNSAANIGKTLAAVAGGAASANYLTPVVVELAKIDAVKYHYGIAFILGFMGLRGIEVLTAKLIPQEMTHANTTANSRKRSH